MDETLPQKEQALKELLMCCRSVAVAFSGGVDSALLLDVAHEVLGAQACAITACMRGLPVIEREAALQFCRTKDIRHFELAFDELTIPGFCENTPERCYLCKKALFTELQKACNQHGFSCLIDGSNTDDEREYRPGAKALAELAITSPLKIAGFTKADIRLLSQQRGLTTWDKPACACLSTRLPSGTRITEELLDRIEKAEAYLYECGVKQVRVRVYDGMARIEVDEESIPLLALQEIRTGVDEKLRALGFSFVTLDLRGYQTGSTNAVMP